MYQMIKKNKYILKLLIAMLTLTGCVGQKKLSKVIQIKAKKQNVCKKPNKVVEKEKHTITIWIHGTRAAHGLLHKKLLKNFFHRELGLVPASSYENIYHMRKIADILCKEKTKRFRFDNFTFFGWSGNLDHEKRKKAAQELDIEIKKLIAWYKTKHGVIPKIRLITHSHGGNVALCLSEINKNKKEKIYIDELVLLACPVQEKTAHMIKDNIFKKVYSLYSTIDLLQVIDPQGLQFKPTYEIKRPFFSKRVFKHHKKLIQTRVKINGRGILHVEFLLSKFIHLLPYILEELDTWKKNDKNNKKLKLLKIRITSSGNIFRRKILKKQVT